MDLFQGYKVHKINHASQAAVALSSSASKIPPSTQGQKTCSGASHSLEVKRDVVRHGRKSSAVLLFSPCVQSFRSGFVPKYSRCPFL